MICSSLKDLDVTACRGFSNWVRHRSPGAHLSLNVEWTFTSAAFFSSSSFFATEIHGNKRFLPPKWVGEPQRQNYIDNWENKAISFLSSFHIAPCAMAHEVNLLLEHFSAIYSPPLLSLSLCGCHICSLKPVLMYQLFWSGSAGVWTNKLDCAPVPPQIAFPLSAPAWPTEAVHYIFSWNISIQAISPTHIHAHTQWDL